MTIHTQKTKKKARTPTPEEVAHAALLRRVAAAVTAAVTAAKRRDAEQGYDLGAHLAQAREMLPAKTFGAWVKENCAFTPRLATSYIAVHENLQPFRDRLIAAAVKPTILLTLAYASPEKVEEVVAAIEADGRMTVGEVKRRLKGEESPDDASAPSVGGRQGLLRAAQAKSKTHTSLFSKEAAQVLKEVEAAAALLEADKRLAKSALHEKLGAAAGRACQHLVAAVETELDKNWMRVRMVLAKLSELPSWPGRAEFPSWLLGTVLPVLRFAVLGESSSTHNPQSSAALTDFVPGLDPQQTDSEDDRVMVTSLLPVMVASSTPAAAPGIV